MRKPMPKCDKYVLMTAYTDTSPADIVQDMELTRMRADRGDEQAVDAAAAALRAARESGEEVAHTSPGSGMR